MKKIIVKFNEAYFQTFQQSRLLTQIFAFSITVILFLYFFDTIYRVYGYDGEVSPQLLTSVKADLIVIIFTAALFAGRFLLLFSKRKTVFWVSQLVWLTTILAINSQITPSTNSVCAKNLLPVFGETIGMLLLAYFLFSPLRQIITLLVSIAGISTKKEI